MTTGRTPSQPQEEHPHSPWPGFWALCLGFFMILVDQTIVAVATPALTEGLHTGINAVLWVTSAYLLAFAVPLLITGRLGDRFGPKLLYQVGLVIFTLSSLWCGLSTTIGMLIVARVFQGIGAALLTPQTLAVITRTFPANKRGVAMGMWGTVAGVATLVGPVMGGVLIDALSWEWIFFVNVPIGVVGFAMAQKFVPTLSTHAHRFDWVGVVFSGVGMFLLIFAIQEGENYDWGTIAGPISVWSLIGAGVVVLAAFVVWQGRMRGEPLVPLRLFKDRNFSLANVGITTVGFAVVALAFPLMLYAQNVLGLGPTEAALLMVPMAAINGLLSRPVGTLVDRMHPRYIAGFGLSCMVFALVWLWLVMRPGQSIWMIELPVALMGVANACMWSPLSATCTRNLPMRDAGSGSGVYNTTRQVGAVLGSAGIAVAMQTLLIRHLGASASSSGSYQQGGQLPQAVRDGFSSAMGQSLLLPAAVLVIGVIAALLFERPTQIASRRVERDTAARPSAVTDPAT